MSWCELFGTVGLMDQLHSAGSSIGRRLARHTTIADQHHLLTRSS